MELKTTGGVIFITILLHFHYLVSLDSEVFLLRISFQNADASVVTCQYPQIYNFNFGKEYLETLCVCIYLGFSQQALQHPLRRTVSLAVSSL